MAARHRARFRSIHVRCLFLHPRLASLFLQQRLFRFCVLSKSERQRMFVAHTSNNFWYPSCASLSLTVSPKPSRRLLEGDLRPFRKSPKETISGRRTVFSAVSFEIFGFGFTMSALCLIKMIHVTCYLGIVTFYYTQWLCKYAIVIQLIPEFS